MTRTLAAQRQLVRNFGTCLNFNGTNTNYVTITSNQVDISVFTYSAWVFINSAKDHTIRGDTKSSGTRAPKFKIRSDRKLELDEQGVALIGTSTGTIPLKQWTHVAVSYDAIGNYAFYINGIISGTGTSLRVFQFGDLEIGTSPDAGEDFFGKIDDFRIYSSVLSAINVQNLYYGIEPNNTPLVWCKFDEGSGTSAIDSSGNSNTGIITGATYSSDVFMVPRAVAATRSLAGVRSAA